jgi:hypothetical protein
VALFSLTGWMGMDLGSVKGLWMTPIGFRVIESMMPPAV